MPVLKLLLIPQFLIAYVILCLIVGILGRGKQIGFWGFFLLSLLLTPILPAFSMLISRPRRARART
jgi:hypothetical protein